MNRVGRMFLGVMILGFLFLVPSGFGANELSGEHVELEIFKKKKWEGIWDYTVEDVPPEYRKGALHIAKEGREHSVKVELEFATIPAEQVVVKKKNLSFVLNLEGQLISIALERNGDSFTGESTSQDGTFYLEGKRRDE